MNGTDLKERDAPEIRSLKGGSCKRGPKTSKGRKKKIKGRGMGDEAHIIFSRETP